MRIFDADITFAEWINFYFDYLYHSYGRRRKKLTHRIRHSTNEGIFFVRVYIRNYYWLSCGRFRSIHAADDLTAKFNESKFSRVNLGHVYLHFSADRGVRMWCVAQHLQLVDYMSNKICIMCAYIRKPNILTADARVCEMFDSDFHVSMYTCMLMLRHNITKWS